ncbi:carbohydrate kinase family protein [Flavobacterium muglaense]|uniref:Carbohydrate kinase n=1 Tax=Flavobacterium muglaense TaxID=2764716 RepID=A0A923SEQ2_9FLAO|nr:PfkB family carbohydrate kinase [Flavobacterium muglaense]MBC5837126.1 carbohydrate kinase [Flavobacterium muglaense]MBC5843655.1 carbohydrate kinase [Flavobacterium muglaense]
MEKKIDIICAGEVLIDFIGHEINTSINRTKDYHRFLGGSPTNVAVNAARLGLNSVLVATCGQDGLGEYIVRKLNANNVVTTQIRKSDIEPTSVIFVSKSTGTPDFIPYREADYQIHPSQIPEDLLSTAKIFHTTCFALSKNPARQTILDSAKKAQALGLQTSIDINFSERIWPDREEAKAVLKEYLSTNPLVKLSEDDCYRLFAESKTEDYIFEYFHGLGASTICLTKGKDGVVLSDKNFGMFYQKAQQINDIKDATGAGDAFWTGFLYARLKNKNFEETISIAQKLAVLKLRNVGRLPEDINIADYLNTNE